MSGVADEPRRGDDWTNAEIVRSLRRIEATTVQLDEKIDSMDGRFVRADLFESVLKSQALVFENHDKRISSVEGWGVWVTRIILGALIVAILALLIQQKGTL